MTAALTALLDAARVWSAPPPPPPPGRYARPAVPAAVADRLERLPAAVRRAVLDPLDRERPAPRPGAPVPLRLPVARTQGAGAARRGDRAPLARQTDATTCGSAVLTLLRLAGDPAAALDLALARDPAARFAALQRAVQARTGHAALGPAPWPRALGTPPWTAAREARYDVVRWTHRVVDLPGPRGTAVLAAALAAARAGVPVPLLTGGDLASGWSTAVPRHVVLLTAVQDDVAVVWEPSSGARHGVPVVDLLAPAGRPAAAAGDPVAAARRAALGGWPHVVWALLPAGAGGGRARPA